MKPSEQRLANDRALLARYDALSAMAGRETRICERVDLRNMVLAQGQAIMKAGYSSAEHLRSVLRHADSETFKWLDKEADA